jgi:hypothetical protein
MKLLVVSATYIIAFNQRKWVQMLAIDSDLQVKLVTPQCMSTSLSGKRCREHHPAFDEEVVSVRSLFSRSHMGYLVDPFALAMLLLRYKPDRIHIEEDPYSVVGFETVLLARVFARRAKISFFSGIIWRENQGASRVG